VSIKHEDVKYFEEHRTRKRDHMREAVQKRLRKKQTQIKEGCSCGRIEKNC
jgi:hypothetical protein